MITATRSSTLDGWLPEIGGLVWMQMYDPQRPAYDSTIEERIAADVDTYGSRILTRVLGLVRDHDGRPGITRFHTKDDGCGPGLFPSRGHGESWTESDWCVLEDASEDTGRLF